MALTCSSSAEPEGCPTPEAGSKQGDVLGGVRRDARLTVLYPCYLPQAEELLSGTVTGTAGRQRAELVFGGPFDLTIRQSQYPPAVSADPAGASQVDIDLFPNVRATLIEINDGSRKALYHVLWSKDNLFYEVQAVGPPLQRSTVLQVARSLQ